MNGYNGWTNYATWNVMLWIDNDESMYREKMRQLNRAIRFAERVEDIEEEIDARFAEFLALQCLGEASTPDLEDTDGCRWSDVDWQEIADHLIDEAKEEFEQ